MKWFAAHIIFYFRFKDGVQDSFPIWENIYLIAAAEFEEARKKATELGKRSAGDDGGSMYFQDRPAELLFVAVRKIVSCVDEDERPTDGTEITYSDLEVADRASLDALAQDLPVLVKYKSANGGD